MATAYGDRQTVFEATYDKLIGGLRKKGIVDMDDVLEIMSVMRKYEMDCHCAVAGQNGVGKSFLMLMMLKKANGEKWIQNLLLARHTGNDLVRFILDNSDTTLGIDEMNQYFNYRKHMDSEQNHIITQIELARSNRIAFLGCVRDPRKLTLNYRQGKLSIVVWILDRFSDSQGGSYAMVFVGNPAIESYDKFGFSMLMGELVSIADAREMMEELPSFIGYMKIPNAATILKDDEIGTYKDEKQRAMAWAHFNHLVSQVRKRKMPTAEAHDEVDRMKNRFDSAELREMHRKIDSVNKRRAPVGDDE